MVLKTMAEGDLDKTITARELSHRLKTPFDTTSKVMQAMNNAGILKSSQGVKGGYSLNKDLSRLSYRVLTEVIEGSNFMYRCATKQDTCSYTDFCTISPSVRRLNELAIKYFDQIMVEEILNTNTHEYFANKVPSGDMSKEDEENEDSSSNVNENTL